MSVLSRDGQGWVFVKKKDSEIGKKGIGHKSAKVPEP